MGASRRERSSKYKNWLLGVLQSKKCHRILDLACGKGVDSVFLLEQGMEVVSCDDAEAMLVYARSEKTRLGLKDWVVKRANWLTLSEDLPDQEPFDAVLCLGSSILHLVDLPPQLGLYRKCLTNFRKFLKPGGLLLIDHRNLDSMLDHGIAVNKNIYHKVDTVSDVSMEVIEKDGVRQRVDIIYHLVVKSDETGNTNLEKVLIPIAPVHVHEFTALLKEMFGSNCNYSLYGDLELQEHVDTEDTAYFQHVVHE
ncbi:glycine N-methyltransferase-like [Strongylocentrotus purpuratus]|uniref:Glycine N-methyltransferase n=1 Tax=Strongylocentrotus purpuratus TaxID=7668 RepID=A0A7M7PEG4_STRPU|nr:glycine N-methyltransferase-like [Strongylocentrotus purpuratus]